MIKVQDWVATIPEEEKHIAYVGEGMTETREFFLCGEGWEKYKKWSFYLDMAFDPESITKREIRQTVKTTRDSSESIEDFGSNIQETVTKESYTSQYTQVREENMTDIAPLQRMAGEDGIRLMWTVLRQHTNLPGKLWATLRAVGENSQYIKKSAVMVFEVEPAISAEPAEVSTLSELEQVEEELNALRRQANEAAENAVAAADVAGEMRDQASTAVNDAVHAAATAEEHRLAAQKSADEAEDACNQAEQCKETVVARAAQVHNDIETITAQVTKAGQEVDRVTAQTAQAKIYYDTVVQQAAQVRNDTESVTTQAAQVEKHLNTSLNVAAECGRYAAQCEETAADMEQKWNSMHHHRINVCDYGATGDGVTDDQPAIWAAFTAAKALIAQNTPCEVYFPAGTYGILNGGFGIKLPQGKGGLRITGAGREITTIQYLEEWQNSGRYGNGWYALDISPEGSPTYWNYGTYIHDVAVTGLTIRDDYPDKHATHTAKGTATRVDWAEENHGVNISFCVRAAVTDCNLINLGDEVIDIYSCEDTIVMNNHIEGCPAAGPGGGAIAICDASKRTVVTGNTIHGSGTDYMLTAEDFGGADGITLKAGVEMSGAVELPDGTVIGRYTKITQDTFIPVGTKILKNNYGICVESLFYPVQDVVVSGNTICDIHGTGISMNAVNEGASITNVILSDNVINADGTGIKIGSSKPKSGIKIHNNIVFGCVGKAIDASGVEDITVCNNTFRNIGYGVSAYTSCGNSRQLYADNVFENVASGGIYTAGTVIIKDCVFNGIGTAETPPATIKEHVIGRYGGEVTVSGCVLKDVRLSVLKGAINEATYIDHTDIELISKTGVANAGGAAISGDSVKRIIGGKIGGRITIGQPNAIVQGVTITSSNIGESAITVKADSVSVTGCNINIDGFYPAIKENDGCNYNLFANNIVNRNIVTAGAQSVAVNNIDTRATA